MNNHLDSQLQWPIFTLRYRMMRNIYTYYVNWRSQFCNSSIKNILLFSFSLTLGSINASDNTYYEKGTLKFIENKGQWIDKVKFKAEIPGGILFLEEDRLTYLFYNSEDISTIHEMHHQTVDWNDDFKLRCHAYSVSFKGSNKPTILGVERSKEYNNYFLGSDSARWSNNVGKYFAVEYKELYPNIDFRIYADTKGVKYDFIVHKGGDPDRIKLYYEGMDKISIVKRSIVVRTSVNNVIEQQPFTYQEVQNNRSTIASRYKLDNSQISFVIDNSYDKEQDLIIDPALVFASYSGSTADNWGFTATYDESGHMYSGGIAFGAGYPTTTGAFQINYSGTGGALISDIVISKYSPDGSTLEYSTYLGGTASECPHSLVVDNNDNLIVFGTTGSTDFPTTTSAFDRTFNGGSGAVASAISYPMGSDIIVSKFNSSGTALIGSSFVGGSANDGLNLGSLAYNYADNFRGEVIVGDNNSAIIVTSTSSTNFPVTGGAQNSLAGSQDACAFQMNDDLSSLDWSTFIGGSSLDAGYGVQRNSKGEIYLVGGTQSTNFPTTSGTLGATFNGGTDGFIVQLTSNGSQIQEGTYIGTSSYDQVFFVQFDANDDVYIVGQTEGVYPLFPSTVYNNGRGQFVHKMSPDLGTTVFSTRFGTAGSGVDIALSAFLVNQCDHIYISGWGGVVNGSNGGPTQSTTVGLPLTADALQSSTDGNDFYLIVLAENATSLKYATFFGGGTSSEHVDGGTSRFDKDGIVYQAVCGGCGGNSDFPTTPGAWSNTNNSLNCNIASIKFDLSTMSANADVGSDFFCTGESISFVNLSNGGTSYLWDFGDGTTSTSYQPMHTYADTGTYEVSLIVTDPTSCIFADTTYLTVTVSKEPNLTVIGGTSVCVGDTLQLFASGADNYSWVPATGLNDASISNPVAVITSNITYTILGSSVCGSAQQDVPVSIFEDGTNIIADTNMCKGDTIVLFANGADNYQWTSSSPINNSDSNKITISPLELATYTLSMVDSNDCEWTKQVVVDVDTLLPIAKVSNDTIVCIGDEIQLAASGGAGYVWVPDLWLDDNMVANPLTLPLKNVIYRVGVWNGCGIDYDTVQVEVHQIQAKATNDTLGCWGNTIQLSASGGESYLWTPEDQFQNPRIQTPEIEVFGPAEYQVLITDTLGCTDTKTVQIDTIPKPFVEAGLPLTIEFGKEKRIEASAQNGEYYWSPEESIDCPTCLQPNVSPEETTTYFLTMVDKNGCQAIDSVIVYVSGALFVPNTFTPNDNGLNDIFLAYGREIATFHMLIFDRWGQVIFESKDINQGWDGSYKGEIVQDGTYVWKINYTEVAGKERKMIGHVNLLR